MIEEYAVLKSKVTFIDFSSYEYYLVKISDFRYSVEELDKTKAKQMIAKLDKVHHSEYGTIYATPGFYNAAQPHKKNLYNDYHFSRI